MSKKRKQPVRREWEQADLAWKVDGRTYRVLILGEGEFTPTNTSAHYDHCFEGPSLVVVEQSCMGTNVCEHDLHDVKTWSWIGRLMRDGLKKYGAVEMLSPVDMSEEVVGKMMMASKTIKMPTRLLLNADGEARPPRPGDKWDVLFIRNDGWSLAAPTGLRSRAKALWDGQWAKEMDCPGTTYEQIQGE